MTTRHRPSRVRPIAVAGVAATLAAATLTPSAAADTPARPCQDAPERPVTTGAVFNNPAAGDGTPIIEQICSLVKQAPAGSLIRIAHFVISGTSGADFVAVLTEAHRRGVDVQVVLDGWQVTNPAVTALRAELGTDQARRSWLHVCTGLSPEGNTAACIGTKGQHNKFYLFSETGGREHVVLQSSANFTDLNSTTYWNNAMTIAGNAELYEAYGAYFGDLAAERRTDDYDRTVTTTMRTGTVAASFFPRADGDPITELLDGVSCGPQTVLRVGMSEWDAYRIAIAERLAELAGQGCEVAIVHGLMDDEVRAVLAAAPAIALRELDDANVLPGRIHSKYVLIEGGNATDRSERWVVTGSPNFNHTSLRRNDETMLRTDIASVYARYRANFETMFAAATPG
ncbi:phosphatidylserine/phosphatidylglycerophosphate/cardiolipin synthase family protein [Jiangella aurantiaca]|uniref:phospholipase D n=1 Tax=Jiangella aurantiaca TaxID=2530373 RepID=A0A4R5A9A3_9ACTN|nr:phospholipase D-like domain-containing protein [Jiangella aurantiaca]TDD67264.1 phosphatidylserine/phosphatidylglycerophosphate/cardiolipin synthase family protein [Jiangella aurantiaca]